MSKKFKNIENDEEFKNFKLEDYLPSMNRREPKADTSASEQEPTVEEKAILFPPMDEPDTSAIQAAVSESIRQDEPEVRDNDADEEGEEVEAAVAETDAPAGRTIVRRISSKQRRLSLDEYRSTYLQVPKIADRKPVFVSREVRDRLDRIVRCLGGRGMSVSGLVENLARQHLAAYGSDIDQWRKL
ncbi:DUF3408 domain-containing protein [Parabacteroides sp. ZJ-118]|uniref:DUF3408 domain-containing protein n=1 Tax=Parabacteroides sp. ZJ-118 TaxID=2709398 RepID=UPI0013EE2AED|nr:DUF3408 domain-containing protein [Parabacteroides sp. ZJ-118]